MGIKSIFTTKYGEWCVFYKKQGTDWVELKGKKGYWYADPILFKHKNQVYLFTEAFQNNRQIGRLAVSKYINGTFTEPKEVIRRPYHLSYPCVFEYKDTVYMIPESSQNHTLEIYKALDESLENWEFEKEILKDIQCVDTTVFEYRSIIYLITYIEKNPNYITKVYTLDMNKLDVNEVYSISKNENTCRPAGKIIEKGGTFFRPVQYNINTYGEKIRLLEINPAKNDWMGRVKCECTVNSFGVNDMLKTHTYSQVQEISAIDALHEYVTLLSPYYVLRRKCHNFYYKIKIIIRKKIRK